MCCFFKPEYFIELTVSPFDRESLPHKHITAGIRTFITTIFFRIHYLITMILVTKSLGAKNMCKDALCQGDTQYLSIQAKINKNVGCLIC